LGPEVAERFIEPFVSGIFAGDAGDLAVAAAFPSLKALDTKYGSIVKGAIKGRKGKRPAAVKPPRGLLSFRKGLSTLPRAIAAELGDRLKFEMPAREVVKTGSGFRVVTDSGDYEADRVQIAAPPDAAARMVRSMAPTASAALASVPSPALAVLHLSWPLDAFERRPEGFGYLVVPQAARRILGCLWITGLFGGRAPEGQALLTIFMGGKLDPNAPAMDDRSLVAAAVKDVRAAMGVRGEPRVVALTRWAHAIPQYDRGHAARIAALVQAECAIPGLAFLGNYRGGISVGDVVKNALCGT
jgi:oxygen-dependent protoporphyrinogen oxidase